MQTFSIALSILVFSAFVWAIYCHFMSSRITACMKCLSALSIMTFTSNLYYLISEQLERNQLYFGLMLHFLSLGLFLWTVITTRATRLTLAFELDQPQFLVLSGPYKWLRHPFYTAYLLYWAGCVAQSPNVLLFLEFAALTAFYVIAAKKEERKFDESALNVAYSDYKARTGFMLPRLGRTR